MQLLCESSAEGTSEGLGLLTGRFERIDPMGRSGPRKVPHMGWNRVPVRDTQWKVRPYWTKPRSTDGLAGDRVS